jgi:hypothetical protein
MPSERWLLDLVVSFAAGGAAYVAGLLAVGLVPDERRGLVRMARKALGRSA